MSEQVVTNNELATHSRLHWSQGYAQNAPACRADDRDASLVAGIRSKDEAAFADVVLRYQKRLLSMALRITKNHHDAEEVVQEAFLKLFQRIGSFRGDSLFRTWLTRIVINEALMKTRKNSRDFLSIDENGREGAAGTIKELKAAGYSPEEWSLLQEIKSMALTLFPRIGPSSRSVMTLCLHLELTPAEIANRLNLKLSTVKSRLSRGRKELREEMSRYCSHGRRHTDPFSRAA
jgi:RNA polymerase sigma-70 factor (ECF subfamily)